MGMMDEAWRESVKRTPEQEKNMTATLTVGELEIMKEFKNDRLFSEQEQALLEEILTSRRDVRGNRFLPKPFAFLRTYCIGSISLSAIQAAKGIPAVSPPAIESIVSKPIFCVITEAEKSIKVLRTRGYEINFLQSI